MGFNQVCVYWHASTFSSDNDGRVFLCGQDAETVRQQGGGWPGESPVLAQRAVADSPRWTRAVGDSSGPSC
jgi:hypothetical protein